MNNLTEYFFGPLSKDYCIYFYFLTVYFFITTVMFVISSLYFGITKKKGLSFYVTSLLTTFGIGLIYFQNRLLHSMCVGKM